MNQYDRIYNFSAGPSMLPLSVLARAAEEMMNWHGSGMSVMEMSHRSKEYEAIITKAEADLRKLMAIPDRYHVLFLQGGASTQFAAVPLNLMGRSKHATADYMVSGQFSEKAFREAQKLGFDVSCIASTKQDCFSHVPAFSRALLHEDAAYLHICLNNTIYGTKYPTVPDTGEIPLVADLSSCILSEPVDVNAFGVIYAGAQKNMAPAGMTLVIVRKDLLEYADPKMPTMLNWKVMAENGSMYNTPPCYTIYIAGLVYEWLLANGGLEAMAERNRKKAGILYEYLDGQTYYTAPVEPTSRSLMNVTFVTGDAELDRKFAAEAAAEGLKNLKGHRSVGGMRASIYNAMPEEGVLALVDFMERFAAQNPKKGGEGK